MSNDFTLINSRIKKMIDKGQYREALSLLMEESKNPLFSNNQHLLINLQIKNLTHLLNSKRKVHL